MRKKKSSIRGCGCPTLAREQKKAGQAGLGGLGWRKGVVRLWKLENGYELEASKEYGV